MSRPTGSRLRSSEPKNPKTCHERALGLLAVRSRSRRELEQRLLAARFGPEEVAGVLERLESVGLLDDEDFARRLTQHHEQNRMSGRRAVTTALIAKGVAPDTVAGAVGAMGDEAERAEDLARTRAARLSSLEPAKAYARLTSFLMRRGYEPSVARAAAGRALAVETGVE